MLTVTTRKRAGFTLIETIVTVGLVAVLAAFVIPTVIQKAGSGDPVKVQNDLNSVGTAIQTFATDLKNGFPHQLSTVINKPVAGTDRFIDSTALLANQVATWNGPYIAATISNAAGDSIVTGYSAYIMNFLDRYDLLNNVSEHDATGAVNAAFSPTSTLFASVQVHGLTPAQAKALNTLIDGASDANQVNGSNTTGRFRFTVPSGGTVIAYYMAAPITQ